MDLQNLARRQHRSTQELLVLYVLERFLARLAASTHRDKFVLKGGMLLAALNARRPTVDADLSPPTSADPRLSPYYRHCQKDHHRVRRSVAPEHERRPSLAGPFPDLDQLT